MNKYSEITYLQNKLFWNDWKTAADGEYKGYTFAIMYNGVNPCAYVMLPKTHKFYDSICRLIDIAEKYGIGEVMRNNEYNIINTVCRCHGDITWFGSIQNNIEGAWFGWDYMHYPMDYNGYLQSGHKKWTVAEIYEDVKNVIDNLVIFNKNRKN